MKTEVVKTYYTVYVSFFRPELDWPEHKAFEQKAREALKAENLEINKPFQTKVEAKKYATKIDNVLSCFDIQTQVCKSELVAIC